ncbi:hypothetical protein ACFQ9X_56920 [Catenulispora yoronensis]
MAVSVSAQRSRQLLARRLVEIRDDARLNSRAWRPAWAGTSPRSPASSTP